MSFLPFASSTACMYAQIENKHWTVQGPHTNESKCESSLMWATHHETDTAINLWIELRNPAKFYWTNMLCRIKLNIKLHQNAIKPWISRTTLDVFAKDSDIVKSQSTQVDSASARCILSHLECKQYQSYFEWWTRFHFEPFQQFWP